MKTKANNTYNNIPGKIYYVSKAMLLIFVPVLVISSFILLNSHSTVSADDSGSDDVTITLPTSCSIEPSGNSHSETLENNTYDTNVGNGTTKLKTYCNDKDGYIIYAIGASNNVEGTTSLISSTGDTIATGVYTPGDTTSSWSFRIDPLDNILTMNPTYAVGEGNFATIPNTWDWIAKKPSDTVAKDTGATITTTYAAYISGTQPAGTYTGKVEYVLLHPSSSTKPVTLSEAYKNAGKSKVHTTDPITGESGDFYTMQDMTSAICNNTNVYGEASQTQLVDTRDGKLYWATKLHTDKYNGNIGQCWMTENLDLDLETTPNKVAALTSENTNLKLYGDKGYTSDNGYTCSNASTTTNCTATGETITWTPERDTIAPDDLSSSTWADDNYNPYSYDRGPVEPDGHKDGHGYSGNYYNWSAAAASNNSSSYSGGNAANSICPKGWRLPNTRSEEGGYEFSKLLYAYDVTKDDKNTSGYATGGYSKIIASPLYFVQAGFIDRGLLYQSADLGQYWPSTADSSNGIFFLIFASYGVWPSYTGIGSNGCSIRCVAE